MQNIIHTELDPFLETVWLLFVSDKLEQTKQEMLSSLTEHGLDATDFYEKHMKIFERYVRTFEKHRVPSAQSDFFFAQADDDFFLILLALLCENRDEIPRLSQFSDDDINAEILTIYRELFAPDSPAEKAQTLSDIVAFWDCTALSEATKWKLMKIMQSPGAHLARLMELVKNNRIAFDKAYNEIKGPLKRLISLYQKMVDGRQDELFCNLADSLPQPCSVYPSLALALSQLVVSGSCYYGLLTPFLPRSADTPFETENLLLCLKALSDNSKLAVMRSLKHSPKYNMEIAQELGLTAATMSHHLGVLLTCGFVGVTKQGNRIYYHLQADAIRKFLNALEQTLL